MYTHDCIFRPFVKNADCTIYLKEDNVNDTIYLKEDVGTNLCFRI